MEKYRLGDWVRDTADRIFQITGIHLIRNKIYYSSSTYDDSVPTEVMAERKWCQEAIASLIEWQDVDPRDLQEGKNEI